jgi:hypothetical protein
MLCCSRNSLGPTEELLIPPKCKTFQDATYFVGIQSTDNEQQATNKAHGYITSGYIAYHPCLSYMQYIFKVILIVKITMIS